MTSAQIEYEPDRGGLDRLLTSPHGPLGEWMTRLGNNAVNAAKTRANVDTGLMRSRITFTLTQEGGELVGYLRASTSYAIYVHQGTRYYAGNKFLVDGLNDVLR